MAHQASSSRTPHAEFSDILNLLQNIRHPICTGPNPSAAGNGAVLDSQPPSNSSIPSIATVAGAIFAAPDGVMTGDCSKPAKQMTNNACYLNSSNAYGTASLNGGSSKTGTGAASGNVSARDLQIKNYPNGNGRASSSGCTYETSNQEPFEMDTNGSKSGTSILDGGRSEATNQQPSGPSGCLQISSNKPELDSSSNANVTDTANAAAARFCMECQNCIDIIALDKLKRDICYIQGSLSKLSKFERELWKHAETLATGPVREGSPLVERSLLGLITAVNQLKFQLPSTSYHNFQHTDDNSVPHQWDNDDDPGPSTPRSDELEYNLLSPDEKKCLWCFSVFQGEVKKRVLINWWIGQDLLTTSGSPTSEEAGEEMLQALRDKNFIQQVIKKKRPVDSWTMKPSVRSFLRSKAKEDADFFGLSEKVLLLKSCSRIADLDDQVETVFNLNKSGIANSETEMLAYMKGLTVLHLGISQITQPTWIILRIKNLKLIMERLYTMKKLRLLSLRGIPSLRVLPNSVCRLTCLAVLDLSECQALESLPSKIGELKGLTHLDVSSCPLLLQMPTEIRRLYNLVVLKGFVIGPNSNSRQGCRLKDLQMLKKLYKLSIFVRRHNFPEPQDLEDLERVQRLVKLKILWEPTPPQNVNPAHIGQNAQQNADPAVNEEEVGTMSDVYNEQSEAQDRQEVMRDVQDQSQQDDQQNADPVVNEQIEVNGVDVDWQQSQDRDQDEQDAQEIGDTTQEAHDELQNTLGGPLRFCKWFKSCFAKQGERESTRVSPNQFSELEKLDLWCAPDDKFLQAPSKYPNLKKLYIRGVKFDPLNIPEADGKWQNVKTLRLLYIPSLQFKNPEADLQHSLFPCLSYLEYKQRQGTQTSDYLWVEGEKH